MPEEIVFPLDWKSLSFEDLKDIMIELNITNEQDLNEAITKSLSTKIKSKLDIL